MYGKRKSYPYILLVCLCVVLLTGCGQQEEMPVNGVQGGNAITQADKAEPTQSAVPTGEATGTLTSPTATATVTPTPTPSPSPIPTPVVTDPYDGRFWIGRYAEDTAVLMSVTEIAALNEANYNAAGTELVFLSEADSYTESTIRTMIEGYTLPSRKFFDNHEMTASDKNDLMQARNLESLSSGSSRLAELQYGVLIENTDLRSFPTEKRLTSQMQGRFDYLQETKLLVNEPVIILHQSLDAAWSFVQAENYCGWIRESAVAYCTKEELETVADALADIDGEQIAVMTKNGAYQVGEKQRYLRMGTRFLCAGATDDTITIKVPGRENDGNLVWENVSVPCIDETGETCFVQGYLPYTRANVMQLAVRLLGAPYAWGDALSFGADPAEVGDNGMDCSSTVSAVFRCFGFAMPRNTGTQRKMECSKLDVSGLTVTERKELLNELQGGELLYTSGHVMLYLGCEEGNYYVLHNTSTESRDDGGKDEFYRCLITTTEPGKSGQTILDRLIQMNALFPID